MPIRCYATDMLAYVCNGRTGRLHGTIVGPTGRSDQSDEAFTITRSDRRPDPGYVRLHGRSNQSDRPVGPTVAEPRTSVNQISVAQS